jgi:antitoxin YefM
MQSINVTSARSNLYNLVKATIESHEPFTVTSKEGEVIVMSKEDYEAIQETLYLLTNKGLAKEALKAKTAPDSDFTSRDKLPW